MTYTIVLDREKQRQDTPNQKIQFRNPVALKNVQLKAKKKQTRYGINEYEEVYVNGMIQLIENKKLQNILQTQTLDRLLLVMDEKGLFDNPFYIQRPKKWLLASKNKEIQAIAMHPKHKNLVANEWLMIPVKVSKDAISTRLRKNNNEYYEQIKDHFIKQKEKSLQIRRGRKRITVGEEREYGSFKDWIERSPTVKKIETRFSEKATDRQKPLKASYRKNFYEKLEKLMTWEGGKIEPRHIKGKATEEDMITLKPVAIQEIDPKTKEIVLRPLSPDRWFTADGELTDEGIAVREYARFHKDRSLRTVFNIIADDIFGNSKLKLGNVKGTPQAKPLISPTNLMKILIGIRQEESEYSKKRHFKRKAIKELNPDLPANQLDKAIKEMEKEKKISHTYRTQVPDLAESKISEYYQQIRKTSVLPGMRILKDIKEHNKELKKAKQIKATRLFYKNVMSANAQFLQNFEKHDAKQRQAIKKKLFMEIKDKNPAMANKFRIMANIYDLIDKEQRVASLFSYYHGARHGKRYEKDIELPTGKKLKQKSQGIAGLRWEHFISGYDEDTGKERLAYEVKIYEKMAEEWPFELNNLLKDGFENLAKTKIDAWKSWGSNALAEMEKYFDIQQKKNKRSMKLSNEELSHYKKWKFIGTRNSKFYTFVKDLQPYEPTPGRLAPDKKKFVFSSISMEGWNDALINGAENTDLDIRMHRLERLDDLEDFIESKAGEDSEKAYEWQVLKRKLKDAKGNYTKFAKDMFFKFAGSFILNDQNLRVSRTERREFKLIHPHLFRAQYASHFAYIGIPMEQIAGKEGAPSLGVGWVDISTLNQRYYQISREEMEIYRSQMSHKDAPLDSETKAMVDTFSF